MKTSISIAWAMLLAMLLGGHALADTRSLTTRDPQAQSMRTYPVLGFQVQNGDYFAVEPGVLVLLGAVRHRPVAVFARAEAGVGGSGGGVGLAIDWFPSDASPYPNLEEVMFGGLMTVEARVERTYGPTTWMHTTYVGPQVSFNLMLKLSAGWMIDAHDPSDHHVQIGVGAGF